MTGSYGLYPFRKGARDERAKPFNNLPGACTTHLHENADQLLPRPPVSLLMLDVPFFKHRLTQQPQ